MLQHARCTLMMGVRHQRGTNRFFLWAGIKVDNKASKGRRRQCSPHMHVHSHLYIAPLHLYIQGKAPILMAPEDTVMAAVNQIKNIPPSDTSASARGYSQVSLGQPRDMRTPPNDGMPGGSGSETSSPGAAKRQASCRHLLGVLSPGCSVQRRSVCRLSQRCSFVLGQCSYTVTQRHVPIS